MKSFPLQGLLSCVRHCADLVPNTDCQETLSGIRKCFQSLHHVFRLIVKSRLFSRAMGVQNEDSFMSDIQLLFESFNKMFSFTSGRENWENSMGLYFALNYYLNT